MKTLAKIIDALLLIGIALNVVIFVLSFVDSLFSLFLVMTLPPTVLLASIWFVLWINKKSKLQSSPFLSKMLFIMMLTWVTLVLFWFTIFFIEEGNYYEVIEEAFMPAVKFSFVYWLLCLIIYKLTSTTLKKRSAVMYENSEGHINPNSKE